MSLCSGESPAVALQRAPSSHAPLNPKEKPIGVSFHRAFLERERGGPQTAAFFREPAKGPAPEPTGWAATLRTCLKRLALLMGGRDAQAKPDTHMGKISPTCKRDRPAQDDTWKRPVWSTPKKHTTQTHHRLNYGQIKLLSALLRANSTGCTPALC